LISKLFIYYRVSGINCLSFHNEMRYKDTIIFFLTLAHACSLKKCFSSKKIIIILSIAAMDAARLMILKLHNIEIFQMLNHLNMNLRFIERTLKRYKNGFYLISIFRNFNKNNKPFYELIINFGMQFFFGHVKTFFRSAKYYTLRRPVKSNPRRKLVKNAS
jgi:hypothetical protein